MYPIYERDSVSTSAYQSRDEPKPSVEMQVNVAEVISFVLGEKRSLERAVRQAAFWIPIETGPAMTVDQVTKSDPSL